MRIVLVLTSILVFTAVNFTQSKLSVKGGSANLLSAPDRDSTVIVAIPAGELVELIRSEEGSEWLFVTYKEYRGWLVRSQLSEGGGDVPRPRPEIKDAVQRNAVDDHIAAVISKSPKSVRDRGLTELKDQRSEAWGDLDGDGDDDLAASYVLGVGMEPRSTHIAIFENTGEKYRLMFDERLAVGTSVRVSDIFGRRLHIEVAGESREFEIVAGRLTPVETRDDAADAETDASEAAARTANEGEESVVISTEGPPVPAPSDVPGTVSKGVLNGSAIELPKPAYPAGVRVEGAVSVAVVVDENGDVISAAATSGHALLRAAAVDAARRARFSPTFVDGVAVKVSGIIIYNFVLPRGEDPQE
ncbi:MAG TPA: SH3 domain-containing protein [Aridibacter sp.]|nr:SH3 domain-containing protein [Aridibacter sp.]